MKTLVKIIITFTATIALWQITCEIFAIPRYILPRPTSVAAAFWELKEVLLIDTGVTAVQAFGGFIIASFVSLILAVLTVYYPVSKNAVLSSAVILKSIPLVILAPLFLIWFGYGYFGKTLLAGIVTFLPLLISLIQGMSAATGAERDLFKMYQASRWQIITKLLFPKSIPYVMAGLRISAPMAILGSLIAETAGARYGLGMTMMIASANQNTELVFAAACLSAILGLAAFSLVVLAEKAAAKYMEQ
jgi:NitT/TauT family transport system permease protein